MTFHSKLLVLSILVGCSGAKFSSQKIQTAKTDATGATSDSGGGTTSDATSGDSVATTTSGTVDGVGVGTTDTVATTPVGGDTSDTVLNTATPAATPTVISIPTPTNKSCQLDGITKKHGEGYTFFSQFMSSNCTLFQSYRTCNDGAFLGNSAFQYANCKSTNSCKVAQPGLGVDKSSNDWRKLTSNVMTRLMGSSVNQANVHKNNNIYGYPVSTLMNMYPNNASEILAVWWVFQNDTWTYYDADSRIFKLYSIDKTTSVNALTLGDAVQEIIKYYGAITSALPDGSGDGGAKIQSLLNSKVGIAKSNPKWCN